MRASGRTVPRPARHEGRWAATRWGVMSEAEVYAPLVARPADGTAS